MKIAVIGATGSVGYDLLMALSDLEIPFKDVTALASEKSIGKEVSYGENDILKVLDLKTFDFSKTQIALLAAGEKTSKEWAPLLVKKGVVVIDLSPAYRLEPGISLVIPEVNEELLEEYKKKYIIASPRSIVTALATVLAPIKETYGLKRTVISTYESASDQGRAAMDEVFYQTRAIFTNDPLQPQVYPKQIAFNVIPQVGSFLKDGKTQAEWEVESELQKILGESAFIVTCVSVPMFIGHGASLNIEIEKTCTLSQLRQLLKDSPSVSVVDHPVDGGYVTPAECGGEDQIYVSRVRMDHSVNNGVSLWVAADSARRCVALNAARIAHKLITEYIE
jgi:aspartate-semialdehyde dehydrogenase